MKNRRGMSLVELLLVMSACTVVLTTSAALIHRVMQAQSRTRAVFDAERASLRLANDFRRDVRQAQSAELDPARLNEDAVLMLKLKDGQSIEYRRTGGRLVRTLSERDKQIGREEYVFPASCELTVKQQEVPNIIVLSLTSSPIDVSTTHDLESNEHPHPPAWHVPVSLQVAAAPGGDVSHLTDTAEDSP